MTDTTAQDTAVDTTTTDEQKTDLNVRTITLEEAVKRGKQRITIVTLRKPLAGELEGISLMDLGAMDVRSLQTVLPRITNPSLTKHEVSQLEPADLLKLGSEVAAFLLPKAKRQEAYRNE